MIGAPLKSWRSRAMHVVVATTLYTWLMDSSTIRTVFLNPANDEDAHMILPAGVPGASTIVELKKRPLRTQNNSSPILRRFRPKDAQPVSTPLDLHVRLDGIAETALATRPDIAFAVAALCRYKANPQTGHITVAKRVLRYLKDTTDYRLYYRGSINRRLIGFTDSDWAGDSAD